MMRSLKGNGERKIIPEVQVLKKLREKHDLSFCPLVQL